MSDGFTLGEFLPGIKFVRDIGIGRMVMSIVCLCTSCGTVGLIVNTGLERGQRGCDVVAAHEMLEIFLRRVQLEVYTGLKKQKFSYLYKKHSVIKKKKKNNNTN